jgi:hypothetical protein
MSGFFPTAEQRRKYRDYDVVVRDAQTNSVYVGVEDGQVIRWTHQVYRYADSRTFVVYVYAGVTDKERASIEAEAAALPAGEWARFPDQFWFRRKHSTSGRIFFRQTRGDRAPDPFAQLELELMIDATSDTATTR